VVDVAEFEPSPDPGGATVLYSGGMDWYPNRDAVEFFGLRVLPHVRASVSEARFVVAGRGPSDGFRRRMAAVPNVTFTGSVPDMRAEIAQATVCVVPLRIGSGTRLKILEAAAMGKAIVSTRLGAEGLDFADGSEILLADEPEMLARSVASLLRDGARRAALGRAARARVVQDYSEDVLRSQLRGALSLPTASSSQGMPARVAAERA
jgi:glycosyltransferase involved in cell wall biosynthesis